MKNAFPWFLAIIALAALLYFGFKNQPDPVWQETEKLLLQDFAMLDESVDSLRILFDRFHGMSSPDGDSTAFKLISKPFLPTMEFRKFRDALELLEKNQRAIFASINGSGASTLTDRLALFMSVRPENLLQIQCAPEFDLELHKKYLGFEDSGGHFQKGQLLRFWEKAGKNPGERFVVVANGFDKINPETFFGPELWEKLDDPRLEAKLGGEAIEIPTNFYFIAVTHAGVSMKIEMTNEHFRRLGGQHVLEPSVVEFIENLRNKKKETLAGLAKNPDEKTRAKLETQLAALNDTAHLTRLVAFFAKANNLLRDKYSPSHQLGQWSNVRKMFLPGDLPKLKAVFLTHINALEPSRVLSEKEFSDIDYTLKTNGLAAKSSFLDRQIQFLRDTGYFIEITLIAATSIVTALAGWWVFRRREQLLRKYGERTRKIFEDYEKEKITSDEASVLLETVKHEVDDLVLSRKLNYTEALYFLGFIDDKVKRIEFARNTSETFLDLMNTFLEDGILTEKEYQKLTSFLNGIRHKIPQSEFERFREEVQKVYATSFQG